MLIICVGQVSAEEAGDSASVLISSQNPDGSWSGTDRGAQSQIYTTARVLESLIYYGGESDAVDKGVLWIESQNPTDTAALAKVLRVLHLSGRPSESELLMLKEYQNTDGGWGKTDEFESTPWYTGSAIIALNSLEGELDAGIAGGEYLLNEQGAGGDFEDSALITSNCVYALVLLYDATKRDDFANAAVRGYGWLGAETGEDGVWDSTISTSSSVIALDTLYRLTGEDDLKVQSDSAKEWISTSAQINGDPLSTAWSLAALTHETTVSPAQSRLRISASLPEEYVFGPGVTHIKFKIENLGLSNLKNISLLLVVPKELNAEINKTTWEIETLERGGSREFTESIFIKAGAGEGEYPIMIKGDSISSSATLHVLASPFIFEISPTELKNDAPTDFKITIQNTGERDFSIKNIVPVVDESWRGVELNSVQLDLPAGSIESVFLFSALAPGERGEYNVPLEIEFAGPALGERKISFKQKFLVGGGVPSGVLKLVLYGTLVLSVMMLLNLLIGYDLLG
jgi:hypothetical protein